MHNNNLERLQSNFWDTHAIMFMDYIVEEFSLTVDII